MPIAVLVLVAFAAPAPGGPHSLDLVYEASPGLEALAARLAEVDPETIARVARLVGLEDPGAPVRVVLAGEGTEPARSAPRWVSGYALSRQGVVVLLPARIRSYPHGSLEGVLRHELAHVLVARASGNASVPRWLNEGLAMVAGSPWGFADRSRVARAMIVGNEMSLAQVDGLFRLGSRQLDDAYALAGAFTHDLLQRHGSGIAATIFDGMSEGLSFEQAFKVATGLSVAESESSFWRRTSLWYRWVPLLSSSTTLWIVVTVLALLAFRRRRTRNLEQRARWLEEELVDANREGEIP